MLNSLSAAALAAGLALASIPVATQVALAQGTTAPEPPKGATPSDNPGASSGSESGAPSKMKKSSMKKSSMKSNKKKTM